MAILPNAPDPTLEKMREIAAESYVNEPRDYLGASAIGHPCERRIWYGYHGYVGRMRQAELIWAADSGHRAEDLTAERLRRVPGIELYTHTEEGNQYGWQALGGKFRGHVDGVITGLLQAPKTPHVWEHKDKNEKYFSEFARIKGELGEKETLQKWDGQYFAQAQVNMHFMQLDRCYFTVSYAGARKYDSCRTEYQPEVAEKLIDKADRILSAISPPKRISERPDFYLCKYLCDYAEVCHGSKS